MHPAVLLGANQKERRIKGRGRKQQKEIVRTSWKNTVY
jgi:hypothetical protein